MHWILTDLLGSAYWIFWWGKQKTCSWMQTWGFKIDVPLFPSINWLQGWKENNDLRSVLIICTPQWILNVALRVVHISFWCMVLDKGLRDQEGWTQVSGSCGFVVFLLLRLCILLWGWGFCVWFRWWVLWFFSLFLFFFNFYFRCFLGKRNLKLLV